MSRHALVALVMLAAAAVSSAACGGRDSWRPPDVVRIEYSQNAGAFFPSWVSWLNDGHEGQSEGLFLHDGDYIVTDQGPIRYRSSDGMAIKLTTTKWRAEIGATTVTVVVDDDEGRAWVNKATDKELAALRSVAAPKSFQADGLAAMNRIAAVNPGVDLFFGSAESMLQGLAMFKPHAVFALEFEIADASKALANQPQIETMMMQAKTKGSLEVLTKLPNLHTLLLFDWKNEGAGSFPAGLSALRTLMIGGNDSSTFSAIGALPTGLEELALVGMTELAGLEGIEKLAGLRTLSLSIDKKIKNLAPLDRLPELRRVALPPETTQDQFAAFLKTHPNLSILELTENEKITSLAPLAGMKSLTGIVIRGGYQDVSTLKGLSSLRLVGLSKEMWDETPDQVDAIRKALPDALVIRVRPFCLGSGWILLLAPVLVLAMVRARRLGVRAN